MAKTIIMEFPQCRLMAMMEQRYQRIYLRAVWSDHRMGARLSLIPEESDVATAVSGMISTMLTGSAPSAGESVPWTRR